MGYQFHINMDIKSEKYVFSAVSKFAKEKKIKLKVLGRSQYAKEEELFFKNLNDDFIYIKRDMTHRNNSYERIDESRYVVSCDSTLAYEALSKGKKTAIISVEVVLK